MNKLYCEIWPSMAICAVLLLLLSSCGALPLAEVDSDLEMAESSHIPLVVKLLPGQQAPVKPADLEVAESSNIAIRVESTAVKGRQFSEDSELSETFNIPVNAENPNSTPDFDVHSQAEDAGSDSKSGFRVSLFQAPVKTRESVNLEAEAVPSKVLSLYDNSQKVLADKSQPLPILDTISEHEKYGNNGDMFDGISRSLVNGYEAFSNFLNTIIQKPQQIFKSINKSVNAQLDIIGGKLVGL